MKTRDEAKASRLFAESERLFAAGDRRGAEDALHAAWDAREGRQSTATRIMESWGVTSCEDCDAVEVLKPGDPADRLCLKGCGWMDVGYPLGTEEAARAYAGRRAQFAFDMSAAGAVPLPPRSEATR